jgi:nitroimidazol reductase NimA-like FMN-containing flavoprotein (pyridoxamine 5'-phosphate oxidase superfamily)
MIDKIKALVRQQDSCVLATVSGNKPHCSLMAYVAERDCRHIFMVTQKDTKKYRNLKENPFASILIDTRDQHEREKRAQANALTVSGTFQSIDGKTEQKRVEGLLLSKHPYLEVFINNSDAQVFCIKVESFLLLEGLMDAYFETL